MRAILRSVCLTALFLGMLPSGAMAQGIPGPRRLEDAALGEPVPLPAAQANPHLSISEWHAPEELMVQGSCGTIGEQKIAVLLVSFPGITPPLTPAAVRAMFFGPGSPSVADFWNEASYGKATATGDVFGWYALSQSFACGTLNDLSDVAMQAANADVDFQQYNRIFVVFASGNASCGGYTVDVGCKSVATPDGAITGSVAFLGASYIAAQSSDPAVQRTYGMHAAAHEGGHNLGLYHASWLVYDQKEPLGDDMGVGFEAADASSAVGRYAPAGPYAAIDKVALGWLDPSNVQTVTQSGTYALHAFEEPLSGGAGIRALKIQRGFLPGYLWVESRKDGVGQYDPLLATNLKDGALVRYQGPLAPTTTASGSPFGSFLLDFTRNLGSFFFHPALIGPAWTDPYSGLTLQVVPDGVDPTILNVTVTFAPTPTCIRTAPTVTITPAGSTLTNGGTGTFTVTVHDNDDASCGPVVYQLSSPEPAFWGTGFPQPPPDPPTTTTTVQLSPGGTTSVTMTKSAPQASDTGTYTITVNATRLGVTGTGSQTVSVNSSCVTGNPVVEMLPDPNQSAYNEPAKFTFTVRSTDSSGCGRHIYTVASSSPAGWLPGTISPSSTLQLNPTQTSSTLTLTKTIPSGTPVGSVHSVNLVATSQASRPSGAPTGSDSASLTVLDRCDRANPTIAVSPGAVIAAPEEEVNFEALVTSHDSPTCSPAVFTIARTVPPGWPLIPEDLDCHPIPCPPTLTVPPGETRNKSFGSAPPFNAAPGQYTLTVSAAAGSHSGTGSATVGVNPVCVHQNPTLVLAPSSVQQNAGQPALLTATVTNNDLGSACSPVSFSLAASLPPGWSAYLPSPVTVAQGGSVQVPFYPTSPVSTTTGPYSVGVTATSGGQAGSGSATVNVSAVCIQGSGPVVTLAPAAANVAPGQSRCFTVNAVDNDEGAACNGYSVTFNTSQPAGFSHSISPGAVFVPHAGSASATYCVTPAASHAGGEFSVIVTAVRGNTIGDDSTGSAMVRVMPLRTLEAGYAHSVSAHTDGTVWAWGWNGQGQLGDSTLTSRNGPVRSGTLSGVIEVGAGVFHSAALKSDGTVWTWGDNSQGQLGNGSTSSRSFPGQVPGLSGIVSIAVGFNHTLALRSDGTLWAWGDNWGGQLGDGTTTDRLSPFQISGLSGVAAIAAGAYHSLAIAGDGSVSSWGRNAEGELGNGTHTDRYVPGAVPGLLGVKRASCGAYHSIVVLADGTMKGWGQNGAGQIGDGTSVERSSPATVLVMSNVSRIAAGSAFNLAVRGDGSVWSWGQNAFGELGDGGTTDRSTPAQIAGLAGIVEVAAGEDHALARNAAGVVYAWGRNQYGQIGTVPSPQTTPAVFTDESQPAPLALLYPVGGETWQPASLQTVSWTGAGPISVKLSYDAGTTYTTLVASTSLQDVPISVPANWSTARGRLRIDRVGTPASFAQTGAYIKIYAAQTHPWLSMTVDNAPQTVGEFASIARDPWGRTGIAYTDRTSGDLKFALRSGAGWTIEIVDSVNSTGWYTSLAFGADGSPRISYMDGTSTFLRYAYKSAGVWVKENVADTNCTLPTSLAFDSLDRPFIAFQDCSTTRVRLYGKSGGTWTQITSLTGASPSLKMFGNLPRISYFSTSSPNQLHYLYASSGSFPSFTWSNDTVSGTDGAAWSSIVIDSSGNPRISFYTTTTKNLRMAKKIAGTWSVEVVDSAPGDVGNWSSIALDPQSRPRISYLANGLVKIAEWNGSVWQLDTVDSSGDTAAATALTVDAAGNDRIAYFDAQNGDLRYAISQPDVTPPTAAPLLGDGGKTSIVVAFVATGDDATTGTAAAYELRRSLQPINASNFAQATLVTTGAPRPSGNQECYGVTSLASCTNYYFGLKVLDDLGNDSGLSTEVISTDCTGNQELSCN